jgi:3-oxoacyl-[acyl-carrier-protein] synthase-3
MPWKAWDIVLGGSDRTIDPEEYAQNTLTRDRTVLFGDGAGVCLVRAEDGEERGVMDVLVHSDGDYFDRLWANFGGSVSRPFYDPEVYARGEMVPVVQGREVFRLAVTLMPEVTLQILKNNGYSLDDVDLVIMHQANLRINEAVQKRLGLPDEKVFNNIQKYGNTTAATIPMAFHEARMAGRVKDGDLICFVGLGSGLHWGAVLYRA